MVSTNMTKQTRRHILAALAAVILLGAVGWGMYYVGLWSGYKQGQLDYAQHRLRYTVIDGQMIEFLGALPKKEPINEKLD